MPPKWREMKCVSVVGSPKEPNLSARGSQGNKAQRKLAGSDASRGLMELPDGLSPSGCPPAHQCVCVCAFGLITSWGCILCLGNLISILSDIKNLSSFQCNNCASWKEVGKDTKWVWAFTERRDVEQKGRLFSQWAYHSAFIACGSGWLLLPTHRRFSLTSWAAFLRQESCVHSYGI